MLVFLCLIFLTPQNEYQQQRVKRIIYIFHSPFGFHFQCFVLFSTLFLRPGGRFQKSVNTVQTLSGVALIIICVLIGFGWTLFSEFKFAVHVFCNAVGIETE